MLEALIQFVRHVDHTLYVHLNSHAGNWLLDRIVSEEEGNHLLRGGLFLAAYWHLWFVPDARQTGRQKRIVSIVFATLFSLALARLLASALPFRVRPMYEPGLPHGAFAVAIRPDMETWSSFPSDTATNFFCLAIGMLFLRRALGAALLLLAAVWICVPRMYIGLHYATDILAGGTLALAVVWWALRSSHVEQWIAAPAMRYSQTRPAAFYTLAFLLSFEMANLFDSIRNLVHGIRHALQLAPHELIVWILAISGMMAAGAVIGACAGILKRRGMETPGPL